MNVLHISLAALISLQSLHAGGKYSLTHEQWSQPKQVDTVLNMQAVKSVLIETHKAPGSRLLIFYPGGDEGTLWVHELKAWLVALGLSSHQIELRPGSSDPSVIDLQVELPISGNIRQNEPLADNKQTKVQEK